ncbi:MAG: transaldolase [Candidatus Marinamargulisbacteria bacterium]|jgi:transaldolase
MIKGMDFFIDTADVSAIRTANDMGLVDGVTTNPTLIKKAGQDHETIIREISSFIDGPISVETLSEDVEGILKEAKEYMTWGDNIVIKVVMSPVGLRAVRELTKLGIKTNVTVIFSAVQGLLAAKAGATYISPFIGRLDDISQRGTDVIGETRQILDNYGFDTKIIVASIRHPVHILDSALMGADISTIPPKTLAQLFRHPLTDKGIQQFLADAKEWKSSVPA